MQVQFPAHLKGLTDAQVIAAQAQHGKNTIEDLHDESLLHIILRLFREPMILILIVVSVIYFFIGDNAEAYFLLFAILVVAGISLYQDNRNRLALKALKTLVAPSSKVIRDGQVQKISTFDIVPDDLMLVEEGDIINADARIVYNHDFSVNESTLTGEAFPQFKATSEDIFSGTLVSTGMAVAEVMSTGKNTRLGKLGKSLLDIKQSSSPLAIQISRFVRNMSLIGMVFFVIICVINFLSTGNIIDSLLKGLTLAMSILPEEIPVAFVTFMALGSRRLLHNGILVKHTTIVEALGNTTVICTDKTGTLTENKMELAGTYSWDKKEYIPVLQVEKLSNTLIEVAMWASEPFPFDPMEKSLHDLYGKVTDEDKRPSYQMVHEYPLDGIPPMMTHVFENDQHKKIIASKGAPEAYIELCGFTPEEKDQLLQTIDDLASRGLRLLGVAKAKDPDKAYPKTQQSFVFDFLGIVAFRDPPKKNIKAVFQEFTDAGIKLKIITGDNPVTTSAVAREAGFQDADKVMNGQDLVTLDEAALSDALRSKAIFTRMFPEAKLKAIEGFKAQGEVVAMLGDGVNDGPALKSAHIGVAMGTKGTEVAKNAADIILLKDDLAKLIDAIRNGRRIYTNLKKAIQYIISIHIPIILTVTLPLVFGWLYPNIFTPVHIIFLELIMGPTCSIVYENDPADKNVMKQPPRPVTYSFLSWKELSKSIIQGVVIAGGVLFAYQYAVMHGLREDEVRTMTFVTLVFSNILLTLVNRSAQSSLLESMKARNYLVILITMITISCLLIMLFIPFIRDFFRLSLISWPFVLAAFLISAVSVLWIEVWKWNQRNKMSKSGVVQPSLQP